MTTYDETLAEVLARLKATPPLIDNANVRRAHPTDVTLDNSPAVRVIDGADKGTESRNADGCDSTHEAEFTVRIILRGDAESVSADAWDLAEEVLARLSPIAKPYGDGILIRLPSITPDREVADQDLYALDMVFPLRYRSGAWTLSAP